MRRDDEVRAFELHARVVGNVVRMYGDVRSLNAHEHGQHVFDDQCLLHFKRQVREWLIASSRPRPRFTALRRVGNACVERRPLEGVVPRTEYCAARFCSLYIGLVYVSEQDSIVVSRNGCDSRH